MNNDFIGILLTFFGMGLFLSTLSNYLNIPLKTGLILSVGIGCLVGGLLILINSKQKKNDSKTDEKLM